MKEFILTILSKYVEQEVGLIKGSKKREVWKGRDSLVLGTTGNHTTIYLSLLNQAMETTQTSDLGYISLRLQLIIRDVLETTKRAYSFDRFTTVPELIRWFKYPTSKGRLSKIIVQSCNGDVKLISQLYEYLKEIPFYWDNLINPDNALRMIDEQIKATSSPAVYELKQLRVA